MIPRIATLTKSAAVLGVASLLFVTAGAQEKEAKRSQNPDATIQQLQDRIDELESRITELEGKVRELEGPRSRLRIQAPGQPIPPVPRGPSRFVPPRPLPEGWQRDEINGMEFYIVPLDGKQSSTPSHPRPE